MKKLIGLLVLFPSLALAQVQIGATSGSGVQIGGNQPGVSSIQGQTGDFTFTGDGFGGCSTVAGVTTCTFNGGGLSLTTLGTGGPSTLSGGILNIPIYSANSTSGSQCYLGDGGLVGTFTDGSGLVKGALCIGKNQVSFTVPTGATQLQLGINDDLFADNTGSFLINVSINGGATSPLTVNGDVMPWSPSSNPLYNFGMNDGSSPVVALTGLTAGDSVTIAYQSGTVKMYTTYPDVDADGWLTSPPGPSSGGGPTGSSLSPSSTYYPTKYMTTGYASGAITALTGDGTATGPGIVPFTLATVNGTPGTCGDATHVCQVTTNTKGLVTAQSQVAISGGGGTPGGTTGNIQYNNGGSFGGDPDTQLDGSGNATVKTLATTGAVAGQGGTWDATEGTAPSAAAGHDLLYADSTAHCIKQSLNGGSFSCIGGGSVSSVSNSDGTLTISPTTGAVVASCTAASTSQSGCVEPDGVTTNISGGKLVATAAAPSGAAGGDLSGTYPNPSVANVNNAVDILSEAKSAGGTPLSQEIKNASVSNTASITIFDYNTTWQATYAYVKGSVLVTGGHIQKVTTAGTSGGSTPTFNTAGGTTSDGTVTWTDDGTAPSSSNGYIGYFWLGWGAKDINSTMTITTDGATVFSDRTVLFFAADYQSNQASFSGRFVGASNNASNNVGFYSYIPIPFTSSAKIVLTNASGGTVSVWDNVFYNIGVADTWPRTRKLRTASGTNTSTAFGNVYTLLNATSTNPGRLLGAYLNVDGTGSPSPLTGPMESLVQITTDGRALPNYESSGTEDYFGFSLDFQGYPNSTFNTTPNTAPYSQAPYAAITVKQSGSGTYAAYRFHIMDPVYFTNALKFQWNANTSVSWTGTARLSYCIWYYTE